VRFAFLLFACVASAQDERRIASPNGQMEFRLFIAREENNLSRLAYQVFYRGQPLVKTSFLGLDIEAQEPLLGENVGLTSAASAANGKFNSLIAKFMQNGSLGRLINIEARAYDDGIAFRYVIPPSTPLADLVIVGESTEFQVSGAVEIGESKAEGYPAMHLVRTNETTQITKLDRTFEGATPLTCPWRIIALDRAAKNSLLLSLPGR
jgi:hypothetical protein